MNEERVDPSNISTENKMKKLTAHLSMYVFRIIWLMLPKS
jgi:hypothetical protein